MDLMPCPGVAAEDVPRGSAAAIYYAKEFPSDWAEAIREAREAGDAAGVDRIRTLWFDYFEGTLRHLGPDQLINYLENRHVWRRFADWPVYKTVDTPCLAFTAFVDSRGEAVTLTALGICYKYPSDDSEEWWQTVILPRARSL